MCKCPMDLQVPSPGQALDPVQFPSLARGPVQFPSLARGPVQCWVPVCPRRLAPARVRASTPAPASAPRACRGRRVGAAATGRVMGRRRQRTALPTVAHLLLALRHRASASKPPESPMAFLWVRLIPAWSRQALRPASGRKYLRSHFHLASARQIRRAEECRSRI